jgi:hypothetical protein
MGSAAVIGGRRPGSCAFDLAPPSRASASRLPAPSQRPGQLENGETTYLSASEFCATAELARAGIQGALDLAGPCSGPCGRPGVAAAQP